MLEYWIYGVLPRNIPLIITEIASKKQWCKSGSLLGCFVFWRQSIQYELIVGFWFWCFFCRGWQWIQVTVRFPIEIFPFTSSLRLNFAESLEIFSMTLFSSRHCDIINNDAIEDMSIRLMLTPVLSCLPNSLATATKASPNVWNIQQRNGTYI